MNPLQKYWADVKAGLRPPPDRSRKRGAPSFRVELPNRIHGVSRIIVVTIYAQTGTISYRELGRRKSLSYEVGSHYVQLIRNAAGMGKKRRRR